MLEWRPNGTAGLRDVNADAISCETIREIVTVPVVVYSVGCVGRDGEEIPKVRRKNSYNSAAAFYVYAHFFFQFLQRLYYRRRFCQIS